MSYDYLKCCSFLFFMVYLCKGVSNVPNKAKVTNRLSLISKNYHVWCLSRIFQMLRYKNDSRQCHLAISPSILPLSSPVEKVVTPQGKMPINTVIKEPCGYTVWVQPVCCGIVALSLNNINILAPTQKEQADDKLQWGECVVAK